MHKNIMRNLIIIAMSFFLVLIPKSEVSAIEEPSMMTTPVILLKNNKPIAQGTGFYYALHDKSKISLFLVTNYHVVTNNAPNSKKTPEGDSIIFYIHKDINNPEDIKKIRMPLFTKSKQPLWLISKTHTNADVAIIPLITNIYKDVKIYSISKKWTEGKKIKPTSIVTLIGYPYGYYDNKHQLPVWKTGSVASEPYVDFQGDPKFLIDISAFHGMSGAPAFALGTRQQMIFSNRAVKEHYQFVGIYASMQMLNEKKYIEELSTQSKKGIIVGQSLELGHIWKASLIEDIIKDFDPVKYTNEILLNMN